MKLRLAMAAAFALSISLVYTADVAAEPRMANTGTITRLVATDAPDQGDVLSVSSTERAQDRINNSNLYYEIIAPDGVTVVATHSTSMPKMSGGDTYDDSWTTSNTGFPSIGTYTVTLCWSTGQAQNCDIASAQTTFYSVPTLGWGLWLVGLLMLVVFLWSRREEFERRAPAYEEVRHHDH